MNEIVTGWAFGKFLPMHEVYSPKNFFFLFKCLSFVL